MSRSKKGWVCPAARGARQSSSGAGPSAGPAAGLGSGQRGRAGSAQRGQLGPLRPGQRLSRGSCSWEGVGGGQKRSKSNNASRGPTRPCLPQPRTDRASPAPARPAPGRPPPLPPPLPRPGPKPGAGTAAAGLVLAGPDSGARSSPAAARDSSSSPRPLALPGARLSGGHCLHRCPTQPATTTTTATTTATHNLPSCNHSLAVPQYHAVPLPRADQQPSQFTSLIFSGVTLHLVVKYRVIPNVTQLFLCLLL